MNTPISWIKAYVPDLDCTVQEYVDKMTLSGSHVENAVYLDKNLEKIVVGRIEKIEKHPDADKLVICQVNVGAEEVQIVTGASNVFNGSISSGCFRWQDVLQADMMEVLILRMESRLKKVSFVEYLLTV